MKLQIIFLLLLFSQSAYSQKKSAPEIQFGIVSHFGEARLSNRFKKPFQSDIEEINSRPKGVLISYTFASKSDFHFTNELQILRTKYNARTTQAEGAINLEQTAFELSSPLLFGYEIKKDKINLKFYTGINFKFGLFSNVKKNQSSEDMIGNFNWTYLARFAVSIHAKNIKINPFVGIEKSFTNITNTKNNRSLALRTIARMANLSIGVTLSTNK